MDPNQPCHTYTQFGRLPPLNKKGWSIVCVSPSKLSEIFGVNEELDDLSTMFVDKTIR